MKKVKDVLLWVFVVFCGILVLGFALSGEWTGSILMLLVAVMSLPSKQVRGLWERFLGEKQADELSEENKPQLEKMEKEKEQEEPESQTGKQKNRNMLKPVIIAVMFCIAVAAAGGNSETSTNNDAVSYVDDTEKEEVSQNETESLSADDSEIMQSETDEPEQAESADFGLTEEDDSDKEESTQEEASSDEADDGDANSGQESEETSTDTVIIASSTQTVALDDIPEYSGSPYVTINDNVPFFSESDLTTTSYESYSELDSLGRCGVAVANIGQDIMPTEERGSIGSVKPTGWHTVKYDIVDGNYLYNRCHLIGYQLSGENANEKNLITGTRYLNVDGMLPFENMVADYVEETNNHVLYRVTPIFDGDNLVASGVLIEAMSVEDNGDGVLFNVYCYNVQPGIGIDYATGDSWLESDSGAVSEDSGSDEASENTVADSSDDVDSGTTYVLNTNTKKFHYPSCSSVDQMDDENKQEYTGSRDDLIEQGYSPCGRCNP